jgi:hypothetical protein
MLVKLWWECSGGRGMAEVVRMVGLREVVVVFEGVGDANGWEVGM